jgi:hypothetical protein
MNPETMYALHYYRQAKAINDGRMLVAMFDLTPSDAARIRKRKDWNIYIRDEGYFYINKVVNYQAAIRQYTMVELIKADSEIVNSLGAPVRPTPTRPALGSKIVDPIHDHYQKNNDNTNIILSNSGGVFVKGKYNVITADTAIVFGDGQDIDKDGVFIDGKNVGEAVGQVTKIVASQTGTNDPTQDILIDQIGQVSFTRFSAGTYDMTFTTNVFDGISVLCSIANSDNTSILGIAKRNNSIVRVTTRNTAGTLIDGVLDNASIIIEIQ